MLQKRRSRKGIPKKGDPGSGGAQKSGGPPEGPRSQSSPGPSPNLAALARKTGRLPAAASGIVI